MDVYHAWNKITAQLPPWLLVRPGQRMCTVDPAITLSQTAQARQRTGPLHPAKHSNTIQ